MKFFGKNMVYLGRQSLKGKNGVFTIAKFGCPETYTQLEVFVPLDLVSSLENVNSGTCDLVVDVSQRGFQKNVTLIDIKEV